MTEADYLRGELIHAKGMLAAASGILSAVETIVPDFAKLPTVGRWQAEWHEFSSRSVAVLPEGVK